MGGYDKSDAAKDTDSSISKVSEAWHNAKDDSGNVRESGSERSAGETSTTKGQQAELQAIEAEHGMPESSGESSSE